MKILCSHSLKSTWALNWNCYLSGSLTTSTIPNPTVNPVSPSNLNYQQHLSQSITHFSFMIVLHLYSKIIYTWIPSTSNLFFSVSFIGSLARGPSIHYLILSSSPFTLIPLVKLSLYYDFKYYPYASNSQIYSFNSEFSFRLQIHVSQLPI